MAVTIRDVAKLAGTSITSVSATLGNCRINNVRVGDSTRERILAAAKELGYTAKETKPRSSSSRVRTFGVMFADPSAHLENDPVWDQIRACLIEEAFRAGINLTILTAPSDTGRVQKRVPGGRLDGYLVVAPTSHHLPISRDAGAKCPAATLFGMASEWASAICIDESQLGAMLARHLHENLLPHLYYVGAGLQTLASQDRLEAIDSALCRRFPLRARTEMVPFRPNSVDLDQFAWAYSRSAREDLSTGLLASTPSEALRLLKIMEAERVPDANRRVISMGTSPELTERRVAQVEFPIEAMVRAALQALRNSAQTPTYKFFETRLIGMPVEAHASVLF